MGSKWSRDPYLPASAHLYSLWPGPDDLLAGGQGLVYRRTTGGWRELPLPDATTEVAAVSALGNALLVGTETAEVFRSDDRGATWERVPLLPLPLDRPARSGVRHLLPNPAVPGEVWAALEPGGVFATGDAGRTWSPASDGLPALDVHALAWSSGSILVAALPTGVATWRSARWFPAVFEFDDRYCRSLAGRADRPGTMYCGFGDGPRGTRGGVAVSTDGGRSWRACAFDDVPQSAIWSVATSPEAPDLVLACARAGEVFLSLDGGGRWRRVLETGAETRAVACVTP